MIDDAIRGLVEYGLETGLIEREDAIYARNQILDVMGLSEYREPETPKAYAGLEEILKELLDDACARGLLESDSVVYRDLFDTRLMNCLMPRPSEAVSYTHLDVYKRQGEWYLAVNDATGYGETATLVSGLLTMPIILLLAFVLPGNTTLPMVDLVAIPYVIQPIVAMSNGNVVKSVIGSTIVCIIFLYICSACGLSLIHIWRGFPAAGRSSGRCGASGHAEKLSRQMGWSMVLEKMLGRTCTLSLSSCPKLPSISMVITACPPFCSRDRRKLQMLTPASASTSVTEAMVPGASRWSTMRVVRCV